MAQQVNSSSSETSLALKRTFLKSTIALLRVLFIFSKTLPFTGGLVVSYKYVQIAVRSNLMDFLSGSSGKNDERIAAVLTNLQDGLSSIFFVFFSLLSEAYTGTFTAITICAAVSIEGLMLLWISASSSFGVAYAAIFLLAIGNSGQMLVESMYENQLQERIEEKRQQGVEGAIDWNIWFLAPSTVGYIVTFIVGNNVDSENYVDGFRIAALLMGATYLFFLFGSVWYKLEELDVDESNLHKIYRICRAAFWKRKLKYPTSLDCYYWKDYKQDHGFELNEGQRLLPRVPRLFRWLDKAAIVVNTEEESTDVEASLITQERNGKLCNVKEVREVKSLVPMSYLGLFILPYSLLTACESTFFVSQASSMSSAFTADGNDISILFLIADGMKKMSEFICFVISLAIRRWRKFETINDMSKRKAGTIIRVGFGMFCATICSLVAWHVEFSRWEIIKTKDQGYQRDHEKSTSTVALIPQFVLLGMAEGLVHNGFSSLFHWHVAKSMRSLGDSSTELVIGTEKLLFIPFIFIFGSKSKESGKTSHLDTFYLILAVCNGMFFLFYVYYSITYAYKEECPQDEQVTMEDHHQPPDPGVHSNQENSEPQ